MVSADPGYPPAPRSGSDSALAEATDPNAFRETALAILQLEAQKKLSVTDPVMKYVPEVPKAWQQITIQQLLTHVSGIPDFTRAAAYGKAEDSLRIERSTGCNASLSLSRLPAIQRRSVFVFRRGAEGGFQALARLTTLSCLTQ